MKSDPPFARDYFFSPAIRLDIRIAFILCIEMKQDTFGNVQCITASDANDRRLHPVGYPLVMCWTLSICIYINMYIHTCFFFIFSTF